jgi:alginate O-acetyltransferase complex protein AlgI
MHFASSEYLYLLGTTILLIRVLPIQYKTTILLTSTLVFFFFDSPVNLIFLSYVVLLSYSIIRINSKNPTTVTPPWLLAFQLSLVILPLATYKMIIPHLPGSYMQSQHRLSYLGAIPLGLSFYTLQAISIIVDTRNRAYKNKFTLKDHTLFLSFFPQLIAGPIERASNLMSQILEFNTTKTKSYRLGLKLILWGLFKKMVIADNLSPIVDNVYGGYQGYSGVFILFATYLFFIQLYADFSGYCDVAKGSASLLGLNISNNFDYPLSATNIKTFWRKWHVSLHSWLLDYIYKPIIAQFGTKLGKVMTVFLVFIVSSLWHASTINFILWGLSNAIIYIIYSTMISKGVSATNKNTSIFINALKIFITISVINITWVFFRAPNINAAFTIYTKIGQSFLLLDNYTINPDWVLETINFLKSNSRVFALTVVTIIFIIFEMMSEMKTYLRSNDTVSYTEIMLWDYVILSLVVLSMPQSDTFLYFKF